MKILPLFLLAVSILTPIASAKKAAEYPATYAGGTLPLEHNRIRATLGADAVVFMQGGQRIAVPLKSITSISYRTEVRRRAGASVLDVLPLMHLGESAGYYIGVGWTGTHGNSAQPQVLLKLSRAEYRDFLAALQQVTGIKPVDTNHVPTVVRYQI